MRWREVLVCVKSRIFSRSVIHISPFTKIRCRMRNRPSSAQALKICDPRVRLKLFRRMVHPSFTVKGIEIRAL